MKKEELRVGRLYGDKDGKKYLLLDNDIIQLSDELTLHRICALRSFDDVKSGDLGGYIESEANLSHDGDAWVDDNAWVGKNDD